jgi:RpiR family carbohydrate utilization transcriptional regulator
LNLLQHIAQSRHLLRKSELKVADHVLLDPAAVMHSSMADLAHSVGISEPTIVRFCRAIGCSGFSGPEAETGAEPGRWCEFRPVRDP